MNGHGKVRSLENAIAVVGMAGRFPGARNIEEYWANLRDGRESITQLTDEQLLAAGISPAELNDPAYVKAAALLDDMELWDAGFFGFSPKDAAIMDPQHRHFLECCWEAFEHAGHRPDRFDGPIGVFAGCGVGSYLWANLMTHPELLESTGFFLLRHTGNDKDFLSTRVSYQFNLRGPSVNVQTACSTSLVAIHLSSQSLLARECDMALAGGVTIEQPHRVGYHYREGEILSPDGHCRPFEADSKGTVFGSGVGVVVLRRYEDALADGDTIHAVILGSAINNDGSGKVGYLAPSVDGQSQAIAEALVMADVPAETVTYVEAHGTGTMVGDPIEVAALTEAFRTQTAKTGFCALGSVKSNIGHLDTAAGVASFIKAVLAAKHGLIPPTLHFERPNPSIDFAATPFFVNSNARVWETSNVPRRAGISSLGVGGTNAHIVIEEGPRPQPAPSRRSLHLLPLSARSRRGVERRGEDLARFFESEPDASLDDVAYTLAIGRKDFRYRRAIVAASSADAVEALLATDGSDDIRDAGERDRKVVFLFAGGGAQYPGMGRDLYDAEPVFRDAVDDCLRRLRPHVELDLRELLFPGPDARQDVAARLERPSAALPALFTIQYALAKLWMSWGIEPAALIGHSMGEYTAACLSGVFSLDDALAVVAMRGRLFEQVPAGAMTSVPLAPAALRPLLGDDLSIAVVNGPELCVASGPLESIESLERRLAEREIESRRIHIEVAAHSSMLEPILGPFREGLRAIRFGAPAIPFVSNLTGDWASEAAVANAEYWVRHLRETVRFADGLERLLEDPDLVLLEVGPGRTLATLAKQHPARKPEHETLTSMRHPEEDVSDYEYLLDVTGKLWQHGVAIDWHTFHGPARRRVPLPTYPFEHEPYWVEPVRAQQGEAAAALDDGRRDDPADWFWVPAWKRVAAPAAEPPTGVQLVIRDAGPLADAVVAGLREAGAEVLEVEAGSAFTAEAENRFQIRPGHEDDYAAVIREAIGREGGLRGVVHLWNLEPANGDVRSFYSLFHLARALGQADLANDVRLTVVSTGMQAVTAEEVVDPERALALGPVRVIPRELPNVRTRNVDIASPGHTAWRISRAARQIVGEALDTSADRIIAYRGAERLIQRFEPIRLDGAGESLLHSKGVYLITGGLGGIGRTVAEWLAREYQARLILVGRRGLPPRPEWSDRLARARSGEGVAASIHAVQAMEANGAEVVVESADVSDETALRGVIERAKNRFGAIHGVFHLAGALDDDLILLKDAERARRVLTPKVQGTVALDRALGETKLDLFVLFSSRSSVSGVAGQIDYTAANAFLDAFAYARQARDGTPTVAVGWGAWRDVGMAAALADRAAESDYSEWEPIEHPLLDRMRKEPERGAQFLGEYALGRRWMLDEHRLRRGNALIPGSGYLELAREAFLQYANGNGGGAIELSDILFTSPFFVPDGQARELRVRVVARDGRYGFTIGGRPVDPAASRWEIHARGTIQPSSRAPGRTDVAAIRARCRKRTREFQGIVEHAHLDFGPRWGCLRTIGYGNDEALLELELPSDFAGDTEQHGLHPAILDLATGAAQELIEDYDAATHFYVPASYGSVTVFRSLPARVLSHVRYRAAGGAGNDIAVFDITLFDEAGGELADISEFVMVRVTDPMHASAAGGDYEDDEPVVAGAASAPAIDLTNAIRPDEGIAALSRLLRRGTPPHVLALPENLNRILAELDEAAAPVPAREAQRAQPAIDLGPLERALDDHPAVREAAGLAHEERPGDIRIVAFVAFATGEHATVSELRRYLRASLDESLVPNMVTEVDALPRTPAGDIDREALPNPFVKEDEFVAPRTPTELAIAAIWKDLLGLRRVGIHDNFLDVGGHSLVGVRALLQIEKATGVRLHPNLLTLQTLEQIAAECDRLNAERGGSGETSPERPAEAPSSGGISNRLFSAVRQAVRGGQT